MPRRAVKRKKKRNCFDIEGDCAENLAASDKGSYYTQHEFEVVVPGNRARGGNFVALFISADHIDQKAICIVSYPVYYHSYPAARISGNITALGVSVSLESVIVA